MKTIAVTGGSGFIGKHLVASLNNKSYKVLEIDLKTGYNLTREEDINRIPRFDTIIHLAAMTFVPKSFETPKEYYHNNYLTTLNVLELARKFKAKVIYFSSYLYGEPLYLPIDENHPLKPHNPYAHSKLICEKLCQGYYSDFDVSSIIFRPFNIYGKGQEDSFLIPMIIDQLKTGEITLKDPRPKRDFIYVMDIVDAVLRAVEYYDTKFEIFNLGYGKSFSIKELISIAKDVTNSDAQINFTNEIRKGEVLDTVADNKKAMELLGWEPKFSLREGVIHMINEE